MIFANVIFGSVILLIFILTHIVVRRADRTRLVLLAYLQALRWVSVGIVVGISVDYYQESSIFSEKMLWVILSVTVLAGFEYAILKLEREIEHVADEVQEEYVEGEKNVETS